ncbi:MAG: hypothetical protein JO332_03285, partial [Planctomycetaceae bacterium]|nr:hypothetical protein [Planctomycetaceae bacterium]
MRILLGAVWFAGLAVGVAAQQAAPPPLDEHCSLAQDTQTCVEFDGAKTFLAGGPSSVKVYAVPAAGNAPQAKRTLEPRGCVTAVMPQPSAAALLVRAGSNDWTVWDAADGKPMKHALEDAIALVAVERAAGRRDLPDDATVPWAVLPDPAGLRLWDARPLREKRSRILEIRLNRWGDVAVSGARIAALTGNDLLTGDADGFVLRLPLSAMISAARVAATSVDG